MDGGTTGVLDAERRRASFDAKALEEIVNRGRSKAIAKVRVVYSDLPPPLSYFHQRILCTNMTVDVFCWGDAVPTSLCRRAV